MSVQQPLPFWIHGQLVMLKVVASVPADAPVLRLQAGSEMFVAPRLRSFGGPVRPAAGARNGAVVSSGRPATAAVWRVWLCGDADEACAGRRPRARAPGASIRQALDRDALEPSDAYTCKLQACNARKTG